MLKLQVVSWGPMVFLSQDNARTPLNTNTFIMKYKNKASTILKHKSCSGVDSQELSKTTQAFIFQH